MKRFTFLTVALVTMYSLQLNAQITLDLKVFLEGPFNGTTMNTDLNAQNQIPLDQPYNVEPWNYSGTEHVNSIPNPGIVDWVLVELRDAQNVENAFPSTAIARQAAFIKSDGNIVGLDGSSLLNFAVTINFNLYATIHHRNHICIISANPLIDNTGVYSYDFSSGYAQALGGASAQKELAPNIWGLISGDGDNSGIIGPADKDEVWKFKAGQSGYFKGDFDLNQHVNNLDKNDLWNANISKTSQLPWECGMFLKDSRDNQSYRTIQIGTQCWMAENFNFGTMIQTSQAMSDNSVVEKYCYNNEPEKCQIYGGLYQWQEIMQYTEQQGTQGICPPGWHLSANGEWTTLINFLGGNSIAGGKMKEIGTLHWSPPNTGATDESGFTGLPGGFASDFMGEYASFWCSTQLSSNVSCSNFLEYDKIGVTRLGYPNYYGLSLRCIKNQAPFQPMNPIPPNEGLNQSINTIISWSCYHPNFCPMTYDIYFGTINPPELFSSEQNDTTYNPGILLSNTQYFWKIIAHDIYGNNSEGPVWSFTTYQNWTCGYPLVIEHTAGDEAPVNKTVTYGTVETNLSGSNKCWITQNLGASNQATSVTDGTESSRGWYWQFNRKQGYKHDGTIVTPSWTITSIIENYDWLAINDPCSLLLGVGWRLPTYSEWSNVLNNGGWGGAYDAFASVLKLHIAGDIGSNNGALYDVGNYGYYWSGNQSNTVNGGTMSIHAYYNSMGAFFKADGFSVRCLKD